MWPLLVLISADFTTVILETLAFLVIFFLTLSVFNYFSSDIHLSIRGFSNKHNWTQSQLSSKPCYCSVCESLLLTGSGAACDCCGVHADPGCIRIADKKLKCKALTSNDRSPMKHHWVKGNLSYDALCAGCDEECESEPGHLDWQCCWCQRAIHPACEKKVPLECDFGSFQSMIIPPNSIVVSRKRSVRTNFLLRAVNPPPWPVWVPLIVVGNRKSGNNDGDIILSYFRRLLNPAQVVDLATRSPEAALEWCTLLGERKANVLVAGGDGTIGWVLNTIEKLQLKCDPPVAIMPLGTGNDLSRVLGWGKEFAKHVDLSIVLEQILKSSEIPLDRWLVEVSPTRHLGIKLSSKKIFMYNYFSIGVDAQVALDFHRTRESPFYLFSSRIFNKILYLGYGTQQAVERSCQDLEKRLDLFLDGKKMELPSIESVVILNIPSWGAGVHLWTMGDEDIPEQSISDGKLEVVALFSSFHIAQLQMGLSQPHRIGQASNIKTPPPLLHLAPPS
ncbi:Diacylglycerol kinase eta [Gryllus bimaculatus]|nr:Diacylglycerol kinase eta [Gryllus bimaculatus]